MISVHGISNLQSSFNSDNEVEKQASAHTLVYVLNAIVRMLHPFMPFVTEEIYQAIPHLEESICISKYPTVILISMMKHQQTIYLF